MVEFPMLLIAFRLRRGEGLIFPEMFVMGDECAYN
jgi:hypothetical protein